MPCGLVNCPFFEPPKPNEEQNLQKFHLFEHLQKSLYLEISLLPKLELVESSCFTCTVLTWLKNMAYLLVQFEKLAECQ